MKCIKDRIRPLMRSIHEPVSVYIGLPRPISTHTSSKDIDAFAKKHMSINWVTERTKQLKNVG